MDDRDTTVTADTAQMMNEQEVKQRQCRYLVALVVAVLVLFCAGAAISYTLTKCDECVCSSEEISSSSTGSTSEGLAHIEGVSNDEGLWFALQNLPELSYRCSSYDSVPSHLG